MKALLIAAYIAVALTIAAPRCAVLLMRQVAGDNPERWDGVDHAWGTFLGTALSLGWPLFLPPLLVWYFVARRIEAAKEKA